MLKVLRLDTSTYQKKNFAEREKKLIESLGHSWLTDFSYEADILISNSNTEFSKIELQQFKNLKLLIHPNSGYDNITLSWAQGKIPLIVGHEIRMHAVIEYSLSCLFNHFACPPFVKTWDKARAWERKLLKDQTIQLIGKGHIGGHIHKVLTPLVKEISVYDPYKNENELNLEKADVIIFAAGLNPSSEKILSEARMEILKDNVLIINGARGKLIDEASLLSFLERNPSAFAYLDVFEKEPCDFTKFSHLQNTKLSSHAAGVYTKLDDNILAFEEKVLSDYSKLSKENFLNKYKEENLQNRIFKNYIL